MLAQHPGMAPRSRPGKTFGTTYAARWLIRLVMHAGRMRRVLCTITILAWLSGIASLAHAAIGDVVVFAGLGKQSGTSYTGPATSADLLGAYDVTVDANGNRYIAGGDIYKVTPDGTISTIAGNGTLGYSGDGGPATSAALNSPNAVAADAAGNVYIADSGNARIRKVNAAGVISTIAGNGTSAYGGDGGPATQASFSVVQGLAVDATGNIYLADRYDNRIRKIDTHGIITTVAGNGQYGYSGDGGPATAAALHAPIGVSVDAAGNLYIADTGNGAIRKVDSAGKITTIVGNGSNTYGGDGGLAINATLAYPSSVALDGGGNLYIADSGNFRVRRITPAGYIDTVAGIGTQGLSGINGPALSAQIGAPFGVACDASGNLFIASVIDDVVLEVYLTNAQALSGNVVANGPLTQQSLTANINPATSDQGVAGNVFVAALVPGGTIYLLGPSGWVTYAAGNPTAYSSGTLTPNTATLVSGANLTSLAGTHILAGYGRGATAAQSFANLLSRGLYLDLYTLH